MLWYASLHRQHGEPSGASTSYTVPRQTMESPRDGSICSCAAGTMKSRVSVLTTTPPPSCAS